MAKAKLRKYELIYLVQPELEDEGREKIASRLKQALQDGNAQTLLWEEWGKRKLAYEIAKHNKAYYTYVVFVSGASLPHELERILRIFDDCLRYQTIKLEEGLDPDGTYEHVRTAPVRRSQDQEQHDA